MVAPQADPPATRLLIAWGSVAIVVMLAGWLLTQRGGSSVPDETRAELGTAASTTSTSYEPFEMAAPSNGEASTTVPTLGPGEVPEPTIPTTTTTIPGSDSQDPICKSMARLYDVSRSIPAESDERFASAIRAYVAATESVKDSVAKSESGPILEQQANLFVLLDNVLVVLGEPSAQNLTIAYGQLTDPGNPAVAGMLRHLEQTCGNLAQVFQVGLG